MRRSVLAPAVVALVLGAAACSPGVSSAGATTLTVFAAASLTETFEHVAEAFEAEHPGVEVELSLAGSSDLVAQLQDGAPADVLATADEATMARAAGADLLAGDPQIFATNVLRVVTPADDPADVATLADLAGPDVQVVLCAPEVPCGAAALRVEEAAGLDIEPVSEERSVTDVLGKVRSGEADAGLVYATDVLAAGPDVRGLDLPETATAAGANRYPVAVLTGTSLARDFVELLTGTRGRRILTDAGFGTP